MFGFIWRFFAWVCWGISVNLPGWFVNTFQIVIGNSIKIASSLDPLKLFGIQGHTFEGVVISLIIITLMITLIYNFLLHGDGLKMREMTLGQLIMRLLEAVFIGTFGTLAISLFMTILNPMNEPTKNNINNIIQKVWHQHPDKDNKNVNIQKDDDKSSIERNNASSLVNSVLLSNDGAWQPNKSNTDVIRQHPWQIEQSEYDTLEKIKKITLTDVIKSYSDNNYVYKFCEVKENEENDCTRAIKDKSKGYNSRSVGGALSTSNKWWEQFYPVSLALDPSMEKGDPDSQEGKYFSFQINNFWVFIQLTIIAILLGLVSFKTVVNVLELTIWKLVLPLIAFDRLTRDSKYLRAAWGQIIELVLSIFITVMLLNSQTTVVNELGKIIKTTEVGKDPILGTIMTSIMQLAYVFLIYSGSKIVAVFGGHSGSTMNGKSALNGFMQATQTVGNVWNGLKKRTSQVKKGASNIKKSVDGTSKIEKFEKDNNKYDENRQKMEQNNFNKDKIDEKIQKLKDDERILNPNMDENKWQNPQIKKLQKVSDTYDKQNDKLRNENEGIINPKSTIDKIIDTKDKLVDSKNKFKDNLSTKKENLSDLKDTFTNVPQNLNDFKDNVKFNTNDIMDNYNQTYNKTEPDNLNNNSFEKNDNVSTAKSQAKVDINSEINDGFSLPFSKNYGDFNKKGDK